MGMNGFSGCITNGCDMGGLICRTQQRQPENYCDRAAPAGADAADCCRLAARSAFFLAAAACILACCSASGRLKYTPAITTAIAAL